MMYRVQVRTRAMNLFAYHDCDSFNEAVDLAQSWAFLAGPDLPIEIILAEEVTT